MLKGKGRLIVQELPQHKTRHFLYLSTEVARDSKFPLKPGPVTVRIEGETLVIR